MNQNDILDLKKDLNTLKKNSRKYSKKALSVILAAVMLLTMCSVAFGLNATAATTSVLTELAQAIVSDTVLALTNTADSTVTYVAPSLSTATVTSSIYAEDYDDYAALVSITNMVMSEADYLVRQANGYTSGIDYDAGSVDGENMASIHTELSEQLYNTIGGPVYEEYDVDTLLNVIFYGWDSEYGGGVSAVNYGGTTGYDKALGSYSTSSYSTLTFNLTIATDDYVGALNYSTANALNYANLALTTKYTVTMTRISDSTTSCGSTSYLRAWVFKTTSNIANVSGGTGSNVSTADDAMVAAANAYATLMDEMIETYPDFKTIYSYSQSGSQGFEDAYDTIIASRTALASTVVEGTADASAAALALISKMFSSGTAYATCIENFEAVEDADQFAATSEAYNEYVAESPDYGTFDALAFEDGEELIAQYTYFTTNYYNILTSSTDSAYEYFVETFKLDEEYYVNFGYNVDSYKVLAMQEAIEEVMATYGDVDSSDLDEDVKSVIYTTLDTNLTNIAKYDSFIYESFISDEEFAAYYDMEAVYETEVNAYVAWFYDMLAADFSKYETAELLDIFTGSSSTYSSKLSGLNAFYNKIAASAGTETADTLLASLIESANGLYDTGVYYIAAIFEGQVAYAYEKYETLGDTSNLDWSVSLYIELRSTVGLIDTDVYDNLKADSVYTSYVTEEAQTQYATLLADLVPYYEAYAATLGFDTFEFSSVDYVDRDVYTTDELKTESYEVQEEDMTAIIEFVDTLLADEDVLALVAELLGLELAEGETLDLADTVIGLIEDMLYSDSIINTVVQLLYPLVGDNFMSIELPGTYVHDDYGTMALKYLMTMDEIAMGGEEQLAIIPSDLATFVDESEYPEAYAALVAAGDSWTATSIYDWDTELLTINWGVDEACAAIDAAIADGTYDEEIHGTKLEIFVEAMGTALEGIFPFLDALLCGDAWETGEIRDIAETSVTVVINVDVEIYLELGASANDGYVNVLGAIYELLGYTDYMSATEVADYVNNATDIVQMLFDDIYGLIDYIFEAPFENILDALPGLVYALTFDMIPEILGLLETTIWYDALYYCWADSGSAMDDTIYINVGEMLDLADMGIDTTQGLTGFLDLLGINLTIDEGFIATLSELTVVETNRTSLIYTGTDDGKAYYFEADTEAVLYYVLTFILDAVKSGEIYDIIIDVMALLGTDDYDVSGIEAIITDLGFGDAYVKTTDMIAAIVELMDPVKYEDAEYFILDAINTDVYYMVYDADSETYVKVSLDDYDATSMTDAYEIKNGYSWDEETQTVTCDADDLYSEYWTDEQAEYVTDDLVYFVSELTTVLGVDISGVAGGLVGSLLEGLYTTATIDSLLDLVDGFIGDYLTDETISMLIDLVIDMELIDNVDVEAIVANLSSFEYEAFEDGDQDAFVAVLVDYLTPLVPVLQLFLVSYYETDNYIEIWEDVTYDIYEDVARTEEVQVYETVYTYDDEGNILTAEEVAVTETVYTYDDEGNVLTAEEVAVTETVYVYGDDGEIIYDAVVVGDYTVSEYQYDQYTDTDYYSYVSAYDETITVYGYNGYESAIVPIFEALGCDDIVSYDVLKTLEGEDFINAILTPVLSLLEDLTSDELFDTVIDMLPNVLYFIEAGGLNSAIDNLLNPLYAIFDAIRPIYNVKFTIDFDAVDLVDSLLGSLGLEEYIDISFEELLDLVLTYGITEQRYSVVKDDEGESIVYNYVVFDEECEAYVVTHLLTYVAENLTLMDNETLQNVIDVLATLSVLVPEEYSELTTLITGLAELESSDQVLYLAYYLVYGVETGVTGVEDVMTDVMLNLLEEIGGFETDQYSDMAERTTELFDTILDILVGDVVEEGVEESVSAFVQFFVDIFDSIQSFFDKIGEWFKI